MVHHPPHSEVNPVPRVQPADQESPPEVVDIEILRTKPARRRIPPFAQLQMQHLPYPILGELTVLADGRFLAHLRDREPTRSRWRRDRKIEPAIDDTSRDRFPGPS